MIIFTLCSNNYLANAKTLGDSILNHRPNTMFVIGLVDERNCEIDYNLLNKFTIIEVSEIGIENFNSLFQKYNIVEFNTCVKASYFKYLFQNYPDVDTILYFDPDIMVFDSLEVLIENFNEYEILLTPHIVTALEFQDTAPNENLFLNYGVYNLGFIGVHRNCMGEGGFLNWWERRLLSKGFIDPCNGYFVDQLWINLVPIFFQKVKIFKESGLNVAPWNLHERKIIINENNILKMDDGNKLIFFHFSSYNFNLPERISNYERYSFKTNPELISLYNLYQKCLVENNIVTLSKITNAYMLKGAALRKQQDCEKNFITQLHLKIFFKQILPPFIWKTFQYIKKLMV